MNSNLRKVGKLIFILSETFGGFETFLINFIQIFRVELESEKGKKSVGS
jgi:hypothetical protein